MALLQPLDVCRAAARYPTVSGSPLSSESPSVRADGRVCLSSAARLSVSRRVRPSTMTGAATCTSKWLVGATRQRRRVLSCRASEDGPEGDKGDQEGAQEENKQEQAGLQEVPNMPKAVIESLRERVFGFDTFFVTDLEPYEGGVLFKGNLRGDSRRAYDKINHRLHELYGDEYVLFILQSPQDDRPVAVVVPKASVQPLPAPVPEWVAAGAFGFVSIITILLDYSPPPDLGFIPSSEYLLGPLLEGVPAAVVFALLLAAHEAGHWLTANPRGVQLSLPYFVPSWQLGCFGAVTRITNIVKSREDLLTVAAAGPLLGSAAALLVFVLSLLLLQPAAGEGIVINASAFHDSLLVGGLTKLLLGPKLVDGVELNLSPVTLAAWTAMLVNAINSIPVGELDGGRISLALFGRRWANRLSLASLVLLGITGIFNDVALFWVVLILFLQRGPITPQEDEITPPSDSAKLLGAAALVLGVLVYAPLPVPF